MGAKKKQSWIKIYFSILFSITALDSTYWTTTFIVSRVDDGILVNDWIKVSLLTEIDFIFQKTIQFLFYSYC